MAPRETYDFAEFTLDAPEQRLSRYGRPIPLAPKTLGVLVALVRNSGRLVTKRDLLEMVWPEAFVEEGILAVHVSTLRKALGDGENGRCFIETVPRSGYRFTPVPARRDLRPAANPEVYELFGRGRAHLLAGSMFEIPKAVEAFRAAIALDPEYAAAQAGLALACCAQAAYRLAPPADAYAEAKTAALRALALDSASADAQVALGSVMCFSEWNWTGAERSLQRALQLNPGHSEAWLVYGQLLEAQGRLDEGLAAKRKALERDPFSPMVHLQIALAWWHQRRYDDAIEWADKALAIDPRHPHAREFLAAAYLKKGDPDRYLAENLKHAELHGAPPEAMEPLKQAFAGGGHAGMVALVLRRAAAQPQAFPAMQLALFHADAGDLDAAFHHLDRAIEARDPSLVHLAVAPQWDKLRADARFDARLARMGLR